MADNIFLQPAPADDGTSGDVLVRSTERGKHKGRWAAPEATGHANLGEHKGLGLARRSDLKVNPLNSGLVDDAVADGTEVKLSEGYSTLGDAQANYPSVTSLDQTLDWAVAQTLLDQGKAVEVPELDIDAGERFTVNSPILLPSYACFGGRGARSWVHNIRDSGDAGSTQVFHSGMWVRHVWAHKSDEFSTAEPMDVDDIDQPTIGDRTVSRQTVTIDFSVGDLCMIYDEETGHSGNGMLNRIVAVDDVADTVTLQYPVLFQMGATCHITSGADGSLEYDSIDTDVPSSFVEHVTLEGLRVSCATGPWMSRDAVIDGVYRDIHLDSVGSGIYGNAFAACRFERFRGFYTDDPIEIAQGAHSNLITDFQMTSSYGASDRDTTAIRVGLASVLDNFVVNDYIATRPQIGLVNEGATFRNGVIRWLGGSIDGIGVPSSIPQEHAAVDNVRLEPQAAITGKVFGVGSDNTDAVGTQLRDVTVVPPTGDEYVAVRCRGVVDDLVLSNLKAPGGTFDVTNSPALTRVQINGSRFKRFNQVAWADYAKQISGSNTILEEHEELAALRCDGIRPNNDEIADTSKTSQWSYTLDDDQTLRPWYKLIFRVWVDKSGVNNDQRVSLDVGALNVFTRAFDASKEGVFLVEAELMVAADNGLITHHNIVQTDPDGEQFTKWTRTGGGGSNPFVAGEDLELFAWKSDGADTMELKMFEIIPVFPLA